LCEIRADKSDWILRERDKNPGNRGERLQAFHPIREGTGFEERTTTPAFSDQLGRDPNVGHSAASFGVIIIASGTSVAATTGVATTTTGAATVTPTATTRAAGTNSIRHC
jgi:hypothetical protein